jgi:type VI protein secretion system component VasF
MLSKKGDVEWDTLIPWIIALAFLVVMLLVYLGLSGKLSGIGTALRNFFRFGR